VPTPESEPVFIQLADARDRLNEITRQLNEAHAELQVRSKGREHYIQLQKEWAEAFEKFKTATDELAEVLRKLHGQFDPLP